jgi:hypothetical protein
VRTRKRRTPRVWRTSRPHWAIGPRRVTAHGLGRKVKFPRFRGKRVGLSCRFTTGAFGLGRGSSACAVAAYRPPCARTSRRGNSPGMSSTAGHVSDRPPSRIGPGVGSARCPWRSPVPTPPLLAPGSVVGVDLGVTSLAVLWTGEITREPASSGGRPTGAAPPTAPSLQAYRPRQAHATGTAGAVASDPGPHRPPAHRRDRRTPGRVTQAHHPTRADPRHGRGRRPQASPAC